MSQRIYLIEDHHVVRQGLLQWIIDHGFVVSGERDNINLTPAELYACKPELVIIDLSFGDDCALDFIAHLKSQYPSLPVLVFSMHCDAYHVRQALAAGANGYVTKQEHSETLLHAIKAILNGDKYLSPRIASILIGDIDEVESAERSQAQGFSRREEEVFALLGQGYSYREIAEMILLSPKTVESYIARIKIKLGLQTNRELLRMAIQSEAAKS